MKKIYILIPAYKPEEIMIDFLKELCEKTRDIVVVNDGSGEEYDGVFARVREMGVEVIAHDSNKGKGAAIKTGIKYIRQICPEVAGVVTADCDGQHTPKDIMNVAEKLCGGDFIMGIRNLRKNIPLRSFIGNSIMRLVYWLITTIYLHDTQTGLRGLPASMFDDLLRLKGNRYDYEMRMLLQLRRWHVKVEQVEIETVYINNNAGSHYDTLRDSLRLTRQMFAYAMPCLILVGLGYLAFWLFSMIPSIASYNEVYAQLLSRAIVVIPSLMINREKKGTRYGTKLATTLVLTVISLVLVFMLSAVMPPLAAKLVTDVALFIFGRVLYSNM